MNPSDYQQLTKETAIYGKASIAFTNGIIEIVKGTGEEDGRLVAFDLYLNLAYCTGKLNGEAGEVAEQVFKAFRDDNGNFTFERRAALYKELGDVLWYVASICNELDFDMGDIMQSNIDKLMDRMERGVLKGSGDNR